jgi:hypothetical protein
MCDGDILAEFRKVLFGHASIVTIEHISLGRAEERPGKTRKYPGFSKEQG